MKLVIRLLLGALLVAGISDWGKIAQCQPKIDKLQTDYLNSELPKWLKLGGEERVRVETLYDVNFRLGDNTYLLNRLRLDIAATPLPWLTFVAQGQDARVFFSDISPAPTSQQDPIDFRLGYVNIGNSESGPFSLRAGRQGLDFGEGRLLADPNWSNVGRSFDAVRLTLQHGGFRADFFSGASDKICPDGYASPTPGEHLDGAYLSSGRIIPKAIVEPYLFWKMEHNLKGELVKTGNLDEKTAGLRLVGKFLFGLDYGMESAMQRGSLGVEPISAWATHIVAGFSLPDIQHLTRLYGEFNRGSGDRNPKDGIHGTFDILFPSSHDKFGLTDLFCWSNLEHVRGGLQSRARANLSLGFAYNSFWLTNRHDGIYSSGKLIIASNGSEGSFIGQEPDAQAHWNITSRMQFDLTAGHLFAGSFLRATGGYNGFNITTFGIGQRF
ncbi:MAG: alginate export family protein [Terracidiphilus sp.]